MTQDIINVCHGWACPLVTKCARADFNARPPLPGSWVRHYQAARTGEYCTDFVPLTRAWPAVVENTTA